MLEGGSTTTRMYYWYEVDGDRHPGAFHQGHHPRGCLQYRCHPEIQQDRSPPKEVQ